MTSYSSAWLLLVVGCFLIEVAVTEEKINYSEPISPEVYQRVIGQGFNVKYFTKETDLKDLLVNYRNQNIIDIYDAGFRNLRLRCGARYYPYPYNTPNFTTFLDKLEQVVDKCLEVGVAPIISWTHGDAEGRSNEEDLENYITWWTKVSEKLKFKDYRLGFNLICELVSGDCNKTGTCDTSIAGNYTQYNIWTKKVVDTIRNTKGNNAKRILILGSPRKLADALSEIDENIYKDDSYMMAEYHTYAAGPSGVRQSIRYWEGCGNDRQRQTLHDQIEMANKSIPLKTYWAEWKSFDKRSQSINQSEAECFSKYFVSTLRDAGIPWSMNVLEFFYDTHDAVWLTDLRMLGGHMLNMSRILDVIKAHM